MHFSVRLVFHGERVISGIKKHLIYEWKICPDYKEEHYLKINKNNKLCSSERPEKNILLVTYIFGYGPSMIRIDLFNSDVKQ